MIWVELLVPVYRKLGTCSFSTAWVFHINKILIICFIKSETGPSPSKTNFPFTSVLLLIKYLFFSPNVHRMVSCSFYRSLLIYGIFVYLKCFWISNIVFLKIFLKAYVSILDALISLWLSPTITSLQISLVAKSKRGPQWCDLWANLYLPSTLHTSHIKVKCAHTPNTHPDPCHLAYKGTPILG